MSNKKYETKNENSKGFTLAEVLITLGIIGVVAAMTIPTLIKNYQKTVWVNQLKKSVSTLEQGFQKMLADDGVDKLQDTTIFRSINAQSCRAGYLTTDCPDFYSNLKNYFNVSDANISYKTKWLGGSTRATYEHVTTLGDGSFLFDTVFYKLPTPEDDCSNIYKLGGKLCERIANITVDVNGDRGPNETGRDIQEFALSSEGHLYPKHGKHHAIWNTGGAENWESSEEYWKSEISGYCKKGDGEGCAARIIENGWKMDY